jgi:hypothetical protein
MAAAKTVNCVAAMGFLIRVAAWPAPPVWGQADPVLSVVLIRGM